MTNLNSLSGHRRAWLAAILVFSSVSIHLSGRCESAAKVTITFDKIPTEQAVRKSDDPSRDFEPSFLAERLGVAQRASKISGVFLKDKAGRKNGRLQEIVVNLTAGRAVCALVSIGDTANTVVIPSRSFYTATESLATLTASELDISKAPRVAANADVGAILNVLPQSCAYFGQKIPLDIDSSRNQRCKDVLGLRVKNKTGEDLGTLVNLMIDLPTSRITFAIISLTGASTGLYAVPPSALNMAADQREIVLDAARSKVAQLAHSDDFFWCNMADENWAVGMYQAFGQQPDFALKSSDPTRELVRSKVDNAPAAVKSPPKGDMEIQRDILAAMVRDNMDNPLTFKPVKISPSHGVVTLTGHLKSDKLRSKLNEIVAGVVGAENVRNEIETK